ncbi:hypothetical protein Lal_00020930 [Lupinus albus]|nr:hypothetical protein Lal_00020930 [Lupinus albus]
MGRNGPISRSFRLLYANPFVGLHHEDPCSHFVTFYELCGTVGVTEEEEEEEEESLFFRLFTFSLIGKAKDWLSDQLSQYKSLPRKCPNHGFDELTQIHNVKRDMKKPYKPFKQWPLVINNANIGDEYWNWALKMHCWLRRTY